MSKRDFYKEEKYSFDKSYKRIKKHLERFGNTFVTRDIMRVVCQLNADGIEVDVREVKSEVMTKNSFSISEENFMRDKRKYKHETWYVIEVKR